MTVKSKKVTRYYTGDGEEFKSRKAAGNHDKILQIRNMESQIDKRLRISLGFPERGFKSTDDMDAYGVECEAIEKLLENRSLEEDPADALADVGDVRDLTNFILSFTQALDGKLLEVAIVVEDEIACIT